MQIDPPFQHRVCATLHVLLAGQNAVYFRGPKEFAALQAPHGLVDEAKLGFVGELLVLYAESLGVKTCWMGHYNRKVVQSVLNQHGRQGTTQLPHCIITLGYIPERTGFMDRYSEKRMSKKTRTVESFMAQDSTTNIPATIRFALEKASRAPSAMNSQKWYYSVTELSEGYAVELSKPAGYQHLKWHHYDIDVGTAAAHLWLGLKYNGPDPAVAVFERNNATVWRFTLVDID